MKKQLTFVSGAVIKNNKILLLHRKNPDIWEMPGGKIEFGEDPKDAVIREIFEETNLRVDLLKILDIGNYVSSITGDQHIILAYHCIPKTNEFKLEGLDHTESKWFSLEELKNLQNLSKSVRSILSALEKIMQ